MLADARNRQDFLSELREVAIEELTAAPLPHHHQRREDTLEVMPND